MLAPFLLLFGFFILLPILASLVLSFTYFDMVQTPKFIGFDNYLRMFLDDDVFLKALSNTLVFALITGPLGYIICLIFAWLINEIHGKWLGIIILVQIWLSLGTAFLSFIAGLKNIDRQLYEAGAIDGIRNRWQELFHITLPSMGPQLQFGAVMQIGASFSVAGVAIAIAGNPSTDNAGATIVTHIIDMGNMRYEMGYASAISFFLFAIMLFANFILRNILKAVTKEDMA